MLSKNQIKLITSLKQKKYRIQHQLFVVEGVKGIQEFLNSHFELVHLYSTKPIFEINPQLNVIITDEELKKISNLKTPNIALGLFKIPKSTFVEENELIIALDDVRDPGNLGTIIRLCDWFGVNHLVCSENSVDCFNSKVVQATMGSLTRVNIVYTNLIDFLSSTKLTKYGTFMEGQDIYKVQTKSSGIIIFGNEANGISKPIEALIDEKISIPRFGNIKATESLNVATATAIFLSEFKWKSTEM
jgi:TrmH family RNA methyltransferase